MPTKVRRKSPKLLERVNWLIDEKIISIAKENPPEKAAEILCETARDSGSTDDITAIVVIARGDK